VRFSFDARQYFFDCVERPSSRTRLLQARQAFPHGLVDDRFEWLAAAPRALG
jgi:hypothetical protein